MGSLSRLPLCCQDPYCPEIVLGAELTHVEPLQLGAIVDTPAEADILRET